MNADNFVWVSDYSIQVYSKMKRHLNELIQPNHKCNTLKTEMISDRIKKIRTSFS